MEGILQNLRGLQDNTYADFQRTIIPTIAPETIIGVRTPELRKFAKELSRGSEANNFLESLPHSFFEENQLHAFMICEISDFEDCIRRLEEFLPYVDNWATCDQMNPKIFKRDADRLLPYITQWIGKEHVYTVRFAIGMLMHYFLDDRFEMSYADMVADIRSEEYYINMMIAWYFATALAKQYEQILPILTEHRLAVWVHNKTIQKAVESYRITDEQKIFLRSLRRKKS